ncbi:MAG: NifB/NifX family molybdenum-iron cluster-binding protein [Thermoprotei archaeon]|nr:NifB/NifX family molybdenum-iron cluster-binding protein [Thermoprotei archaeon]
MAKYRVAIAGTSEGVIYPGHFAHAEVFHVYDFDGDSGSFAFVEERINPLGSVPDVDVEGGHRHVVEGAPLRGPEKYEWLRSNVLGDADVVIAADACQTSYMVFTGKGVRLIFTDAGIPIEDLVAYVEMKSNEFNDILESYFEEEESS